MLDGSYTNEHFQHDCDFYKNLRNDIGLTQCYAALLFKYYRFNLGKISEQLTRTTLSSCEIELTHHIISEAKIVKADYGDDVSKKEHVYAGLYHRRASIRILLKEYDDTVSDINLSINHTLKTDSGINDKRKEYEQLFDVIQTIRLSEQSDINQIVDEKLAKEKLSLSAMCTVILSVISFVIGTLAIFNNEYNISELILLILTYTGIIIVLCSLVCWVLTMIFNNKDPSQNTIRNASKLGLLLGTALFITACIATIVACHR